MKHLLHPLLFIVLLSNIALAQNKSIDISSSLTLKWETLENNYNNKPLAHAVLTISAQAIALPAKGWKLYFNSDEPVVPGSLTGDINVTHVNGDLYYFSPSANFQGIKANSELNIEMVLLNWLINVSDTPKGFYLVWDGSPQVGHPLKAPVLIPSTEPKQLMRVPTDQVPVATPQWVYEQNKSIQDIPADNLIRVFPTPDSYQKTVATFKLDAGVKIAADPLFNAEVRLLKTELAKLLIASKSTALSGQIKLVSKPMADEAYELQVTDHIITIAASSAAGIFYGIQSLKTMLPGAAWHRPQKNIMVPGVAVTDKPRFGYRAFMLDVARNFQPKQEILKVLDAMALYKLNVLHFHLTDDEGWRLEIPSLPELTAVGAKRGYAVSESQNLMPAFGSGPAINNASGTGHYSKADFEEILRYATQRHILVIPEIESPGHARAAIKAMDARYQFYTQQHQPAKATEYLLRDLGDSSRYTSVQYYDDNVIDVALPSTYKFMETVTNEIERMYADAGAPLKSIHFGGDEVPGGVWEKSPAYWSLMKVDTAIKTTDDLWGYYYGRINRMLQAHHLYLTAWEEAGSKKVVQGGIKKSIINADLLNQNLHLEVWNNVIGWGAEDLAYKLANQGYKVILSPVSNLYFDMAYNKAFDEPGYYWGGYADVDKAFNFIPLDYFKNTTRGHLGEPLAPTFFAAKERPTVVGAAHIAGLQGALWAETLQSPQRMEYMLLPKLLGLAERAWAKDPDWATEADTAKSNAMYNEAWSRFVNVLGKQELPRLSYYAGGFNYRIPMPGAIVKDGMLTVNSQFPGLQLRYTTDGKAPTMTSPLYKQPVPVKGMVKVATFDSAGRSGKVAIVQ
ncbi:family 20 glycosylhydrolase [Mucilaginibacter sp. dw_454]|uniref:family 20 glycosylhydrolase n=1 Tax=Mucilaginibacter sp. dw_454 TaxID=2720079 RepID=UPI001BD49219|nr:family 20 glycosylhydrolase [Mucilaginibacter sp. dw_454]